MCLELRNSKFLLFFFVMGVLHNPKLLSNSICGQGWP